MKLLISEAQIQKSNEIEITVRVKGKILNQKQMKSN